MFMLVASARDIASVNILEKVIDKYPFNRVSEIYQGNPVYEAQIEGTEIRLITLETELVQAQNLTDSFPNTKLIVFISRHSSSTGTPTLSVHVPGNLGEAELGGIAKEVSVAPANPMRNALITMQRLKNEMRLPYEVSYECTHHGPSLEVPTMFAELGSTPTQWADKRAAEVVAHAAVNAITRTDNKSTRTALGIGGPHYNAKFTRLAVEGNLAFGHIIPKYVIASVDQQIVKHCVERTMEKVEAVVLDWKGIKGEDKPRIKTILDSLNLSFEKA